MTKIIKGLCIIALGFGLIACDNNSDDDKVIKNEEIKENIDVKDEEVQISTDIDPDFKELMDSYEAIFDDFIAFMNKYNESEDTSSMMLEYLNYMTKLTSTMDAMEELENVEMSDAETLYYIEVSTRIMQKLSQVEY